MIEVTFSREDANTEFALLAAWLVEDGAPVRTGDVVCVVETSKASVEVEAPQDGLLLQLVAAGAEVAPGSPVALVGASVQELERAREWQAAGAPAAVAAEGAGRGAVPGSGGSAAAAGEVRATRRAEELARLHEVDLAELAGSGFVTAAQVEAYVRERDAAAAGTASAAGAVTAVDIGRGHVLSLPQAGPEAEGVLAPAFLERLAHDPDGVRALDGESKSALYREHGAVIGAGVELGSGVLLAAPRIVLGDGVRIGAGSTLRCAEALVIGELTHLGEQAEIDARTVILGANLHVGRRVRVGGGGRNDPEARLEIGDLTFVGDEVFVNPCRPVLIGREVFLTMRSVLVTHNIGHSILEGYENRFAPITIEDRAQVGIATVVYAGCTIGAGAIVGSNSYVVSDVPPGKLAIGVPARVAGEARIGLRPERQLALARALVDELARRLEWRGCVVEQLPGGRTLVTADAVRATVWFEERLERAPEGAEPGSVVLTLAYAGEEPVTGVAVFDLLARRIHGDANAPLAEAARELCRKRGIRLEPGPWRYRGGLL